ncbi:MAG: hypothetical protein LAO03_22000 [Acidobacteriia bacterium]|nr:hypothetical protein [Terriglobia bacterium]
MSYALALDMDEVARRLLAARRPAGLVPGGEAGQTADRGPSQVTAGGVRFGSFALPRPEGEACAEVSRVADLNEGVSAEPANEAESEPSEIPDAGEGQVLAQSTLRHRGRGVARHTPRKFAAAVAGHAEAGRSTATEAAGDARFLCHLVDLGVMTEAQARELIMVPERIEMELRAFAAENPMDAGLILSTLRFRRRVLVEFERLLAAAACSASPAGDRAPEGGFCGAAGLPTEQPGVSRDAPPAELQADASGGVT